jgi:hypothetical protein
VADSCEYGDEPSGSGAPELVINSITASLLFLNSFSTINFKYHHPF